MSVFYASVLFFFHVIFNTFFLCVSQIKRQFDKKKTEKNNRKFNNIIKRS